MNAAQLVLQWRAAARDFWKACVRTAAQLHNLTARLNGPRAVTRRVAGLEARYQVRAGLDPSYATAGGLSRLVRSILTGGEAELAGITPAERRAVAAAAMRGWSESHGTARPVLAWHRLLGSTVVEVSRG